MGNRNIELGIKDEQVAAGDHIAYFWESEREFEAGVRFLEVGLRRGEFCVVFGYEDANQRVCDVLGRQGFDCDALGASGALAVVSGDRSGDALLKRIGSVFGDAVSRGKTPIRLLGNIGWGRPGWPTEREILAFEAKVTAAAAAFPCVVVCMYDVASLPGSIILHGAFETHPFTISSNILRHNPHHVPIDEFLGRADGPEPA